MRQKPHRERIAASGGGNSQLIASLLAYLKFGKVGKVLRGFSPEDDRKPVMLSDSETSQCCYNLRGSFGLRPQDDQNQQYAVILSDSEESHILRPQNERKPLSLTLSLGERTFDDISRNLTISNLRKFLIFLFPSPLFPSKNKKAAFTLAEVLITLGIIGVVAAITIPTVTHKLRNKILETQFKSSYAKVTQAIKLTQAELGVYNLGTYCAYYDNSYVNANECLTAFKKAFNTDTKRAHYISSSLDRNNIAIFSSANIFVKEKNATCLWDLFRQNVMADGSYLGYSVTCNAFNIAIDVNGSAKPNRLGYDIFMFQITDKLEGFKPSNFTDEYLEAYHNYLETTGLSNIDKNYYYSIAGNPCNYTSTQTTNGIGCGYYTLRNECPDGSRKGYFECLK
jgi:prepilin-type N-terminal cleavage/methylation domain-containing protein